MGDKALTKEDLIYILQALLTLSQKPDNALHRAEDNNLYVKDCSKDLNTHIEDKSVHVTQAILDVLSRITVDENDELFFGNKRLTSCISKAANNALIENQDGLYVDADSSTHAKNTDIHVTKEDKEAWNKSLSSANEYTDQEIGKIPVHDFCFTTQLPTENINETMLYFLANDPDRPLECTYTVYINREGKWHALGVTNKTLNNYLTIEAAKAFIHDNQATLDALTEDALGNLLFHGKGIFESAAVSHEPSNALTVKDGKLYVRDYAQEIMSFTTGGSELVKVNLYDEEISESGRYLLKDSIDNYNLILVEYYYKPNKPADGTPGCIQTAAIDPDTLNDAYSMGMLYILQYGYGVMTSNSQIHIVEDELTVDYYNNVCIYKITGIKKNDGEKQDPIESDNATIEGLVEAVWRNIDNDTEYGWLKGVQGEGEKT